MKFSTPTANVANLERIRGDVHSYRYSDLHIDAIKTIFAHGRSRSCPLVGWLKIKPEDKTTTRQIHMPEGINKCVSKLQWIFDKYKDGSLKSIVYKKKY